MFDRKFVAMALASVAVAGTLTACNNDGKSGESSTASTKATTSSSAAPTTSAPAMESSAPLGAPSPLNCPAVAADTPDTKPETTTTPGTTSHHWYVPALEWTNRNTNVGMWFFSC